MSSDDVISIPLWFNVLVDVHSWVIFEGQAHVLSI